MQGEGDDERADAQRAHDLLHINIPDFGQQVGERAEDEERPHQLEKQVWHDDLPTGLAVAGGDEIPKKHQQRVGEGDPEERAHHLERGAI